MQENTIFQKSNIRRGLNNLNVYEVFFKGAKYALYLCDKCIADMQRLGGEVVDRKKEMKVQCNCCLIYSD